MQTRVENTIQTRVGESSADERFQKFLRRLNKQKTETIFKTRRNRVRTVKKYK
jgi:hypothetical protein